MATEISLDLINQLQVSLRKEAKLSSFDPVGDYSDTSSLPTAAEAIAELDASALYLRCRNCKGKLLRGIDSLICVFCGEQQRTSDNPPDPIKFTSTSGYKWLLSSLNLDGSEMVESLKETNVSSRGANTPVVKGIAVSKFLDLEIEWSAREEKSISSGSGDGKSVQNRNPLNLGEIKLDDFFVEGKGDVSKVDPQAESKPVEDDFNDPRSLSLFDSVKSQGVVGSQKNENVGLFKGNDVQKNVSSENHENLSLFSGRDVQDSVSLAKQGNFGFFEAEDAQHSSKKDENLSLFEGKDGQRTSSSKDDESFGFFEGTNSQGNSSSKEDVNLDLFEGKDAQRTSSSKEDESFGFFEGKDAQRNISSKDDERFGFFEGKDAQRNSSSKDDERFGFFDGKDAQRTSSSKDDERFGFFEGKDAQRNSSSKDDESFGLFESTPSSNTGLKSFDDKVVASSSDWDSGFQSADRNLSQEKSSGDPFANSPVDLSAHMDSVFGSGKDILYATPADSSTAYVSKAGDWLQDDLFGNVTSKTQNNDSIARDKSEGQVVAGNGSSSMDIDWIGDDLWQTNEKKAVEKTTTDDNDDDDDDDQWNDFSGSANSKTPNNPLSQTVASSHGSVVDEKQNIDIGKGKQDDDDNLFGSGKDVLYAEPADSLTPYVSKADDWLQDDLFGNVTSKTQNNDSTVHDKSDGQFVGGNGNSSMDIDWIGDDIWQTNEKKHVEKTTTDDYDDDDEWNDFAGSANSKTHDNVAEHDEKQNIDIGKGKEDDDDNLFGAWNSYTPPTNHVNPSGEQNPEMNLFGATNNNHRDLDSDFFSESGQTQIKGSQIHAFWNLK